MSKQNQIKDFPQNSRKVTRVVIMNMGNSIALDLDRFLVQYFHISFRVKLFVYRFFERTLSMAETILLQV